MDYEKEYKSLVAKVKKAHQFAQTDSTKSVLEDILPQLRESEYKTKSALDLIAEERERQINKGFNWKHDDEHDCHQLSDAAIVYAAPAPLRYQVMNWWPWDKKCLKEDDSFTTEGRIRELVKAGALIVAEIERLQRTINNVTKPNEDEDERLRKELMFFLKEEIPQCSIKEHADKLNEFVSYLEKQKEPKRTPDDFQKSFEEDQNSIVGSPEKYGLYKVAEWSEEDKRAINDGIVALSELAYGSVPNILPSIMIESAKRLQSLRPQPKQEWSEEDEFFRQQLIVYCEECVHDTLAAKCVDWLKSLRPQPHWKPSEEEMKALDVACSGNYGMGTSTWKDLKEFVSNSRNGCKT